MTYLGAVRGSAPGRYCGHRCSRRAATPTAAIRPISADGRYIAFDSDATNLQDGFPAYGRHVIVCDRDPDGDSVFDELRPDGTMDYHYLWLSTPPDDELAPVGSTPSLSADATTVAWNERAVGASRNTVLVTRLIKDQAGRLQAPDPEQFRRPLQNLPDNFGTADPPEVSADGRHVVFTAGVCPAGCYSGPGGPTWSVQVLDLASGRIDRVDLLPDGEYSGRSGHPVISGTGRLIAYEDFLPGTESTEILVVDRDPAGTGVLGPAGGASATATIASRDANGDPQQGSAPALSRDGRYLAFQSSADGLHGDAQGTERTAIVLRDLTVDSAREKAGSSRLLGELGSPSAQTACAAGPGRSCPASGPSEAPHLSADGSVVVFTSAGSDLLPDPCCAGAVFTRTLRPQLQGIATAYGSVAIGNSLARTIVLHHVGFGPLRLGQLSLIGPDAKDFTVSGAENCSGATLYETGSCAVSVAFHPGATGGRRPFCA